MDILEEVKNLKKELVFLRIKKMTKQKIERHKIKTIQKKIAQILQLNQYK
uniref:Ribosomal protein L29 n=1 Tax=Polysiphonia scopulorum TaxID=257860 RepID=A0A1Z1MHU5_9FLOR|nr:ribosomal protein L29 [Polysiphonia scopulorum]ARW65638.1 ribosomal protein L29 [Polysiphonia scopulorum]